MKHGICPDQMLPRIKERVIVIGHAAEVIEIQPMPVAEVLRMVRNGRITDAASALVILLCEPQLQKCIP